MGVSNVCVLCEDSDEPFPLLFSDRNRVSELLPEEKRDFIDISTRRMPLDTNCAFQESSLSLNFLTIGPNVRGTVSGRVKAVTPGIPRGYRLRLQPSAGRTSEVLQKFPRFLHLLLLIEQKRLFILAALVRN